MGEQAAAERVLGPDHPHTAAVRGIPDLLPPRGAAADTRADPAP